MPLLSNETNIYKSLKGSILLPDIEVFVESFEYMGIMVEKVKLPV